MTQPNWLRNLEVTKVALCGRGMNPEAQITLYKSAEAPANEKEPPVATTEKSIDVLEARVAELEAERAELDSMTNDDLAALRGIEVATAEIVVEEEIDKSALPESVVKALADAEADRVELAKMKADARAQVFLAKAAEYEHVAPAADLAPVLETLDRVNPDAAKALDQALKAANARIAEGGLFKELGANGEATADPNAKAEALIAAEVANGLPRHEAMAKVFKANPELLYPAAQ